jgi:hypothetical protein
MIWSRGVGGKTAGGIVFALIFLFLFLSRKKESIINGQLKKQKLNLMICAEKKIVERLFV